MTKQRDDIELLLYQALAEPVGVLLQTEDPTRARQLIYQTRAALKDPELARLQIRVVELQGGNIVIVKGHHFPTPEHQPLALAPTQLNLKDVDL